MKQWVILGGFLFVTCVAAWHGCSNRVTVAHWYVIWLRSWQWKFKPLSGQKIIWLLHSKIFNVFVKNRKYVYYIKVVFYFIREPSKWQVTTFLGSKIWAIFLTKQSTECAETLHHSWAPSARKYPNPIYVYACCQLLCISCWLTAGIGLKSNTE